MNKGNIQVSPLARAYLREAEGGGMKSYNLEVGWSADELAAACEALKACRRINPENPVAAAQAIFELWKIIIDGFPIIESEADRRDQAFFGQIEPYWTELRELKDQLERVIRKATK